MSWEVERIELGDEPPRIFYHSVFLKDENGKEVEAVAEIQYWSSDLDDFSDLQGIQYFPRCPRGKREELDNIVKRALSELDPPVLFHDYSIDE